MQNLVRRTARRLCRLAAVAIFAAATPAGAQPRSEPPATPAPPPENPGLVNEIGKLLKDSGSLLKDPGSLLPSFVRPDSKPDTPAAAAPPAPAAQPAAPAAPAQSAPSAAPAPPAAPAASPMVPAMIDGRQVCPNTATSTADCAAAATMLCRTKGYQQGRSLAVDATEKCSAKVLIPGRAREPGDCRTENFVTRAWCQ